MQHTCGFLVVFCPYRRQTSAEEDTEKIETCLIIIRVNSAEDLALMMSAA